MPLWQHSFDLSTSRSLLSTQRSPSVTLAESLSSASLGQEREDDLQARTLASRGSYADFSSANNLRRNLLQKPDVRMNYASVTCAQLHLSVSGHDATHVELGLIRGCYLTAHALRRKTPSMLEQSLALLPVTVAPYAPTSTTYSRF